MLSPRDVAVLANTTDPELWEAIFETAYGIKTTVYGNRIVLFAPLYISSKCVNNCAYCGFRSGNSLSVEDTRKLREELTPVANMLVNTLAEQQRRPLSADFF